MTFTDEAHHCMPFRIQDLPITERPREQLLVIDHITIATDRWWSIREKRGR